MRVARLRAAGRDRRAGEECRAQALDQLKTGRQGRRRPAWCFPNSACRPMRSTICCFRMRCSTRSSAKIGRLIEASRELAPVFVVGAPLRWRGRLYNCAAGDPSRPVARGRAEDLPAELPRVLRAPAFHLRRGVRGGTIDRRRARGAVRHRPDVRRDGPAGFTFHVEICEDVWVPQPPSAAGAAAGAEMLLNLSASNITIGKAQMRRLLCASQSARCIAAYAYSAAGAGESTTDLAWDGQAGIFETRRPAGRDRALQRAGRNWRSPISISAASARSGCAPIRFGDNAQADRRRPAPFRRIEFDVRRAASGRLELRRPVERFPFVPADPAMLARELLRGLQHPGAGAGAAAVARPGSKSW